MITLRVILVFLTLATAASFSQAQEPKTIDINDPTHLVRQGEIFTVRMVPGDKTTTFYIAGNKAADIKFDRLSVRATAYGPGGKTTELSFLRKDNAFETNGLLRDTERVEFQIRQPKPDLKENLEIKMRRAP
ncbi:MAG: hypothetical protein ACK5P7_01075 [Bdellovibrio sp.]|jgi:hypothetical protein